MCKRWNAMEIALASSVAAAGMQKWKRLVNAAPELLRFESGQAVLAHLHGQEGSDEVRDKILSDLVRASRPSDACGKLARDLVWLAMWPGLSAVRRRLIGWGVEDEDELSAQITTTFAEVLGRLEPTASMKVAATLLWNTRKYLSRALHDGVVARGLEVRLHVDAIVNEWGATDAEWAELLLDLVTHAGPDAELVLACVVGGSTMREAAERCQLPTEVVKKRLQRVIRRLRSDVSADSPRLHVPFFRKKELIGGEKAKRSSLGRRKSVDQRAAANPEAIHEPHNVKVNLPRAPRPRSPLRRFRKVRKYLRGIRQLCKSKCKALEELDMKASTLPVAVLIAPANERTLASGEKVVAYCDVCRRWGERGTIHVCGENWSEHLLSVLATTGVASTARRPR